MIAETGGETGVKRKRLKPKGARLDDVLGYHLRRASMRAMASFDRALGEAIKAVPFSVLCVIDEAPGITAAEIGRRLQLQRANLTPMLADLDARGLVERRSDETDHRIQRLHLSAVGADTLAGWRAAVLAEEARTFAALTADERDALRRLLVKAWSTNRRDTPDSDGAAVRPIP